MSDILVERKGEVAWIWLNRPDRMNAYDASMARELIAAVEGELAALVGAGKPLWHEIVRWTHAIPQYTIGHLERIAAVDRAAASFPGLFWCANWRGGVSVSDCVKNGHAMAGTVQAFAAPPARAA